MAGERLQNCAEIEIVVPESIQPLKQATFQVVVKNTGAGHYLPTGLSEVREMWLHVVVTDAVGAMLFESGALDAKGDVDPGARMYNIVLADKDGNHTANVALADHVESDSRIPPKGQAVETYSLTAPFRALTGLTITATLKYRSASQALINSLLGTAAPTLPVIDMASATQTAGR